MVDGYRVETFDGTSIGVVAGVSPHSVVVERRRHLRRSWRAVPSRMVSIDEASRKVVVLVSATALERSPKLERGRPVDDAEVHAYYQRATA